MVQLWGDIEAARLNICILQQSIVIYGSTPAVGTATCTSSIGKVATAQFQQPLTKTKAEDLIDLIDSSY